MFNHQAVKRDVSECGDDGDDVDPRGDLDGVADVSGKPCIGFFTRGIHGEGSRPFRWCLL